MGFSLGVDIGTTKIACIVVNNENKEIQFVKSIDHNAGIKCVDGYFEQKGEILINKIVEIMDCCNKEIRDKVTSIGVSGQMHGVIEWDKNGTSSNLITWQDQRASIKGKLFEIQKIKGCEELKNGFAFTTLKILNDENKLKNYDYCGTIHDYFVWMLTGKLYIDQTNAASWGLYDIKNSKFNEDAIKRLGIPLNILPKIVKCGSKAGELSEEWSRKLSLREGIPVMVAIGDNQASIVGTSESLSEDECFITIGTSTQMSIIISKHKALSLKLKPSFEIRPFVNDKFIAVTALMCGGQSWAFLKDTIKNWFNEFEINSITDDLIYQKIDQLAMNEIDSNDLPIIDPHFLGERWDESTLSTFSNINLYNFSLGKVAAAMALGIIRNLKSNFPEECFEMCKTIFANGNAVRKNQSLQKAIFKVFGLFPKIKDGIEEAAYGAAILSNNLV